VVKKAFGLGGKPEATEKRIDVMPNIEALEKKRGKGTHGGGGEKGRSNYVTRTPA